MPDLQKPCSSPSANIDVSTIDDEPDGRLSYKKRLVAIINLYGGKATCQGAGLIWVTSLGAVAQMLICWGIGVTSSPCNNSKWRPARSPAVTPSPRRQPQRISCASYDTLHYNVSCDGLTPGTTRYRRPLVSVFHTPQEAPYSYSDTPSFLGNRGLRIEKNIWKTQFSNLGNRPYSLYQFGVALSPVSGGTLLRAARLNAPAHLPHFRHAERLHLTLRTSQ
jgi:hypothetical protein